MGGRTRHGKEARRAPDERTLVAAAAAHHLQACGLARRCTLPCLDLRLAVLPPSRCSRSIHTVDVNDPSTGFGSRDRSQDPTQHKLWKKVPLHQAHACRRRRRAGPAAATPRPACHALPATPLPAHLRPRHTLPQLAFACLLSCAHPLQYVTYYKGLSTDASVLAAMKAAAAGAKTVLVLLDSDHSEANVARELAAYCGFVTVGS